MLRRVIVVAAISVGIVLSAGVPAEAGQWCSDDPPLTISAPNMTPVTVYVTTYALYPGKQADVNRESITYTTLSTNRPNYILVTVYDYIPTGRQGTFSTGMIVTSEQPSQTELNTWMSKTPPPSQMAGAGTTYGYTQGTSGTTMAVSFYLGTS
jgi:hypothetical protein